MSPIARRSPTGTKPAPTPSVAICPCGRRTTAPAEQEGTFTICPDCMRWNRLQSSRDRFQAWKAIPRRI